MTIPKFRAWDKHRNEMNYRVMVGNCDTDDENWNCPIIWIEEIQDWLHFDDYKSIMQSTGLKDKNGKEIFDGDILKVTDPYGDYDVSIEAVFYNQSQASFSTRDMNGDIYRLYNTLMFEVEVIGNIYQNKELL